MAALDAPVTTQTETSGYGLGRRSARQASSTLLIGAVLFACLQIGAAVALDKWFPGLIDPDYGVRVQRVQRGLAADPHRTSTVIMLGSSRTYYGLEAEKLDAPLSRQLGRPVSVVNFGFSGAGPISELLTWRRLRQDGVRADLLLIEVFPAFLSSTFPGDDTREERMPADRLRWSDLAMLARYGTDQTRPALRREFMEAEALALYSHRLTILSTFAPRMIGSGKVKNPLIEPLSPDPFPANLSRQDRERALQFARAGYLPVAKNFHLGGRNCDALRELLDSCRREGTQAALVLMPEGSEFRSWYSAETWRQIQTWLEQMGRNEGVALVNAREWIDDEDFLDSHHLLPRGADTFTQRLGREAVSPFLRRREDGGKSQPELIVRPAGSDRRQTLWP